MPFKSEAQRRYLWANEPEVAQEFERARVNMNTHRRPQGKARVTRKVIQLVSPGILATAQPLDTGRS